MTWFRAFVLAFACLLVSAVACSGGQFSAAEQTGMPSSSSSTSTQTGDIGAGGGTTGTTGTSGAGGDAGSTPDSGTPACKTCADLHTECGTVPNGCGNTLDCGRCPTGQRCQLGHCAAQAYCGNGLCDAGPHLCVCRPPGDLCSRDAQCCSGNCEGDQCQACQAPTITCGNGCCPANTRCCGAGPTGIPSCQSDCVH